MLFSLLRNSCPSAAPQSWSKAVRYISEGSIPQLSPWPCKPSPKKESVVHDDWGQVSSRNDPQGFAENDKPTWNPEVKGLGEFKKKTMGACTTLFSTHTESLQAESRMPYALLYVHMLILTCESCSQNIFVKPQKVTDFNTPPWKVPFGILPH